MTVEGWIAISTIICGFLIWAIDARIKSIVDAKWQEFKDEKIREQADKIKELREQVRKTK